MENGKAFQIGAGNIGRALIGEVMHEAGMHVTFADVNETVVGAINNQKGYTVDVVSSEGRKQSFIDNVDAVLMQDEAAVIEQIVKADIITTAVGANVLPRIAPLLAKGLVERLIRRPKDNAHIAVIACENIEQNTEFLRDYILASLPDQDWHTHVLEQISFPNCAVDRIVPNATTDSSDPLGVVTEAYYQLAVDTTALKSALPDIAGIQLADDLPAVLAQKFFTLNGAHAAVAYWGYLKGCRTIDEAMQDSAIAALARGLMDEVAAVLAVTYPSITQDQQQAFAKKTLQRFMNPYLQDQPERVGREPKRKLGGADRLLKPAILAIEHGQTPANLTMAIVGGLLFSSPQDVQAKELHQDIYTNGIESALVAVTGLKQAHPIVRQAAASYRLAELAA